jgi:hypothetical protein
VSIAEMVRICACLLATPRNLPNESVSALVLDHAPGCASTGDAGANANDGCCGRRLSPRSVAPLAHLHRRAACASSLVLWLRTIASKRPPSVRRVTMFSIRTPVAGSRQGFGA